MHFPDGSQAEDFSTVVAAAADICMKPWRHAVVNAFGSEKGDQESCLIGRSSDETILDLIVRIECRSVDGHRLIENDLELEVFRSGSDLNLILSWCNRPDDPILWQGQHPVWMDGNTGKRCLAPDQGAPLESLARRLRALLFSSQET